MDTHERIVEEQAEDTTSLNYCAFDWSHCFQYYKFEKMRTKNWIQEIDPQQLNGEGKGNPLQCSCLENPRDGEPGGLPSMGLRRVGYDWSDLAAAAA